MTTKLFNNKDDITNFLNSYNIKNYELVIDLKYGYIVNVNETVYLSSKNLNFLPIKFNKILGSFFCSNNNFENLIGAPTFVGFDFTCDNSNLKSLLGIPHTIVKNCSLKFNDIQNLNYLPTYVGGSMELNSNTQLAEANFTDSFEEVKNIAKKLLNNQLNNDIITNNNNYYMKKI